MDPDTNGVPQLELEAVIGFNGKFSCTPFSCCQLTLAKHLVTALMKHLRVLHNASRCELH